MANFNRFPIEGVEVWRNDKNKFLVFQLHYSADPRKKDPAYREAIKSAMPVRQYQQEYELQWDSFAGAPVYADFQRARHGCQERLYPEIGLPLLRGWDFGLTPAMVIAQLVEGQLRVLYEYVELNMGAERFVPLALQKCATIYPRWGDPKRDWIDCIDPSGNFRKDTDMGCCGDVLRRNDLAPFPGPVAFEPRKGAVEYFLTRQTKQGPGFMIDLANCPVLVRGFEGGYRYDEKAFDVEPSKIRPIKDEHSHPHDALQYIACKARTSNSRVRVTIPAPRYGFHPTAIVKEG